MSSDIAIPAGPVADSSVDQETNPQPETKSLSEVDFGLGTNTSTSTEDLTEQEAVQLLLTFLSGNMPLSVIPQDFDFTQAVPLLTNSLQAVVSDRFNMCFEDPDESAWNWNFYLAVSWFVGFVFRYFVLLPLRILMLVCTVVIVVSGLLISSTFEGPRAIRLQRGLIRFMCNAVLFATHAVVRFHGHMPERKKNQIFVSNHTTPLDWVFLSSQKPFAVVGQRHKGFFGFIQSVILKSLDCLWFERQSLRERQNAGRLIKEHSEDVTKQPLLIFPEGVCVNNKHLIMFKRGSFAIDGVEVCPIAMKYNMELCNTYWNSKRHSFLGYLLHMLSQWSVILDVHFLPPMSRRDEEAPEDFANRCRTAISDVSGLQISEFDGYLKHLTPSPKYIRERQRQMAQSFVVDYSALIQPGSDKPRLTLPPLDPSVRSSPEAAPAADPSAAVAALLAVSQSKHASPMLRSHSRSHSALRGSSSEGSEVLRFVEAVASVISRPPTPPLESGDDGGELDTTLHAEQPD